MLSDPLSAYKQTRVKTATGGQLIVMLYDEALKQLKNAMEELGSDNPKLDYIHNSIVKAQDIITELMASLDFEKGGEIAGNLFRLYMFFNRTLFDANLAKDAAGINDVYRLMSDLRQAWAAIENTSVTRNASTGVNLAG